MALFRSDTGVVTMGVEAVAFGTVSANLARWHQCKALPDRGNLKQVYHPSDRVRSGNHQEQGVLGHRSDSTVSVEAFVRGYKDAAPTLFPTLSSPLLSGATDEWPGIVALAHALGQIHVSGGGAAFGTVQAGTTAAAIVVLDKTLYAEGQPICIDVSAAPHTIPIWETRRIKKIEAATHTLTLEFAFSAIPVNAQVVYAGITIFPTQQPQIDSLSMTIQGEDNDGGVDWQHLLVGMCATALGMKWDARGFIEMNMDCDVETWSRTDAGAAPLYTADTGPERQPLIGAKFDYSIAGGAPATMDAAAMEFDAGLSMLRPLSCIAPQGVLRSKYGICQPVITVDPYKEAEATWMTAAAPFRAPSQVSCVFQGGDAPGSIVALCVSNGNITDEPVLGDRDGLLVNPLQITPMVYVGDGVSGTDERNLTTPVGAPWCISFI